MIQCPCLWFNYKSILLYIHVVQDSSSKSLPTVYRKIAENKNNYEWFFKENVKIRKQNQSLPEAPRALLDLITSDRIWTPYKTVKHYQTFMYQWILNFLE